MEKWKKYGNGCSEILLGAVTGTVGGEGDGSTWKGGSCSHNQFVDNVRQHGKWCKTTNTNARANTKPCGLWIVFARESSISFAHHKLNLERACFITFISNSQVFCSVWRRFQIERTFIIPMVSKYIQSSRGRRNIKKLFVVFLMKPEVSMGWCGINWPGHIFFILSNFLLNTMAVIIPVCICTTFWSFLLRLTWHLTAAPDQCNWNWN